MSELFEGLLSISSVIIIIYHNEDIFQEIKNLFNILFNIFDPLIFKELKIQKFVLLFVEKIVNYKKNFLQYQFNLLKYNTILNNRNLLRYLENYFKENNNNYNFNDKNLAKKLYNICKNS